MSILPDSEQTDSVVWYAIVFPVNELDFPASNLPQYDIFFPETNLSIRKNGANMIQIQTLAPWSGLLIDINIYVCLQGVVNCIFLCIYTPTLLCCPFPSQLIKHCWSFTSTFLGFDLILLFICTCPREVVLGQTGAILSSKRWPMNGGVRVGDLGCMYVCTQLCYSASVLRSNANKSNAWNLKWQNFGPFSQSDVCFRIQCCISFMWGEQISHRAPGVCGSRELKNRPIG